MNLNLDTISLFIFSLFSFWLMLRLAYQLKKLKTQQVFILIFVTSLMTIISAEVLFFTDQMSFPFFEKIYSAAIGTVFAVYLSLVCLTSIENLSHRNLRTFWRLPLIGLLVGLYLKVDLISYFCLALYLLSLFVLWKKGKRVRYLMSKALSLSLAFIPLFAAHSNLVSPKGFFFLNIGLSLVVLFCSPILSIANLQRQLLKEESL